MRRRTLLKALLTATWVDFSPLAHARSVKKIHRAHKPDDLIMDQSGSFGDGAFVIGALSCKDATVTARKSAILRTKSNFGCTLSHASRNKWKAKYARELIDLWIDSSDMKIDMFVMKDGSALEKAKSVEKLSRYTELVSRLMDISPNTKGKRRRLVTQVHFKPERQIKFEEMLTARNARIETIVHISERESDLLQLVDLVVGATQASQKTSKAPVANSMKRDLFRYLMRRLGVTSLENKLQHRKCSITFV